MKRWWTKVVQDYFTFSKKDRTGICLLLFIGSLVYIAPRFYKPAKKVIEKDAFAQQLAQLQISVDSSHTYKSYKNNDEEDFAYDKPKYFAYNKTPKGELFDFDPNTLDENGWKRLGLRDKTIQTIEKFVAKGYKFRQPEDIKKIYGLYPNEAERLMPYVHIKASENGAQNNSFAYTASPSLLPKKPEYKARVIDINMADTSAFISLPGIGSKLAARIVSFRDKLGGFANVQQLGETYGVPDSTFQKIKPLLQCDHPSLRTFDINASDANQLKTHPYIKWNIANAIVNYRQQHGNYKSLDDLKKIDIISEDVFNKMAPYLKVL